MKNKAAKCTECGKRRVLNHDALCKKCAKKDVKAQLKEATELVQEADVNPEETKEQTPNVVEEPNKVQEAIDDIRDVVFKYLRGLEAIQNLRDDMTRFGLKQQKLGHMAENGYVKDLRIHLSKLPDAYEVRLVEKKDKLQQALGERITRFSRITGRKVAVVPYVDHGTSGWTVIMALPHEGSGLEHFRFTTTYDVGAKHCANSVHGNVWWHYVTTGLTTKGEGEVNPEHWVHITKDEFEKLIDNQ